MTDHLGSLVVVGGDERDGREQGEILDLGVDENRDLALAGHGQEGFHQGAGDDALVVIGNDDPFDVVLLDEGPDAGFDFRGNGLPALLVDAHDLLVVGDDARLDRGRPLLVEDDAPRFGGVALDPLPFVIVADDADQDRRRAQALQILLDVARASQAGGAFLDLDHRDGRLRRDPGDRAPDVFVDHQIAQHQNPAVSEFADEPLHFRDVAFDHGRDLRRKMGLETIHGTRGSSGDRSRRKTSTRKTPRAAVA